MRGSVRLPPRPEVRHRVEHRVGGHVAGEVGRRELAGAHQHPCQPGALGALDVTPDVVTDHHHRGCRDAEGGHGRGVEGSVRLAQHHRLPLRGVLEGTHERPRVEAEPLGGASLSASGGVLYVAGALSSGTPAERDASLAAYSGSDGAVLWTRQLGSSEPDAANASASRGDRVVIAGQSSGSLGGPAQGFDDAFVAAYSATGERLWTSQLGGTSSWRMPAPAVIHCVAPSVISPPPPVESWCSIAPSMMYVTVSKPR